MKTVPRLPALFLALLLLTACSAPAPARSSVPEAPAASSAPQPAPESPASSAPEQSTAPAPALPRSIRLGQPMNNYESRWAWCLEITDPAEIGELAELLSAEGLTPLEPHQPRWPDGGTPVIFTLDYADGTVEGSTYPQEGYRIESEGGRATLRVGEAFCAWPGESCDALLAFLAGKEVSVVS